MSDVSLVIVRYSLAVFNILGTFGNINIILLTVKNKEFQFKCGVLLALLACCDLLCLWNELQSYIRITFELYDVPLINCFWCNILYIFIEPVEVYVIVIIGFDRLFSITWPFKYRSIGTKNYISIAFAPGILIGLFFVITSFLYLDGSVVEVCVLPAAMPPVVSDWWNHYNMLGAIITVICYAITYTKLYMFNPFRDDPKQAKRHKVILSTLVFQVVIFFFSSVLSAVIIMFVRYQNWEQIALEAEVLAVIPGLLSYTCNYYVYYWRSSEYRSAFLKQIFCGRVLIKESTTITQSRASTKPPTVF